MRVFLKLFWAVVWLVMWVLGGKTLEHFNVVHFPAYSSYGATMMLVSLFGFAKIDQITHRQGKGSK
jgi:hypothetical protein